MHYIRASRHDYDHWEKDLGNKGWSYESVLPYFKNLEDMQIERLKGSPYHGVGGPMGITDGIKTPLGDAYTEAAKGLGYPLVDDPNGESQEGFNRAHFFIRNGRRQSSAESYVRPAMGRKNLHVLPNAHVTKVRYTWMLVLEATRGSVLSYRSS